MTRAHAWLAVLVLGCQGSVLPPGGERPFRPGEDGPGPAAGCDLPQVDLAPLEHLTRAEYDRATTHLLGFEARAARDFAADDAAVLTVRFESGALGTLQCYFGVPVDPDEFVDDLLHGPDADPAPAAE